MTIDFLAVYNTECGDSISLDNDTEIRVWIDPDSNREIEVIVQAVAHGVIAREDRTCTNDFPAIDREQVEEQVTQIVDDMADWHRRVGF